MSATITATLGLAAFLAAAPPGDGSRLEEYGGSLRCKDDAVKAQVVRALSSASVPYGANAIRAGGSGLEHDGKAVHVRIDKATSLVTKPGAAGSPSSMQVVRAGDGAAIDVLMCRYRRSSSKPWSSVTTADLVPNGHLAKRMPTSVRRLGRGFALSEKPGVSGDSVIVLVAAASDGKAAELDVQVASKGLQKRKRSGDVAGKPNAGARIVKEASDPAWKKYEYGDVVVFPEAKDEVYDYENKEFDCSYFTWLVYKRVGIDYDFTGTEGLASMQSGQFVKVTTPRAGDLVVWRPELGSGNIHHVGIVAEDTSTFWDNSGSESVGLSKFSWDVYDVPRLYLRRKGL